MWPRMKACNHTLLGGAARDAERFRGGLVFRLIDCGYHSTLGLRVIKREKDAERDHGANNGHRFFFFFITLKPRVE